MQHLRIDSIAGIQAAPNREVGQEDTTRTLAEKATVCPLTPSVHLEGVCKSYGARVAVNHVDLCILPGELLGLLGPNGAGKSTLMLLMAGVLAPDRGAIRMGKRGLCPRTTESRATIGLAPQSLSLYPRLTAEENLTFFGRMYGLEGARLKDGVRSGLELAALTDRRDDRVQHFSGGMKRRLNLACALVHQPEVLLLDEPTVGVDPQSRDHLLSAIFGLKASGVTIVYSTHYVEELSQLCSRVAIVDEGRLVALDTAEQLIERHGGGVVVEVRKPALADVLLRLTGRSLRD